MEDVHVHVRLHDEPQQPDEGLASDRDCLPPVKQRSVSGAAASGLTASQSASAPVPAVLARRWAMLAFFSMVTLSNAAAWITFAPISDIVELHYDATAFEVNFLSLIYMLAYIPFVFVASWLLDKHGLRLCVFVGAFVNAGGLFVRYAGSNNFLWVVVGQTLAAIAQSFLLGVPARLSAVWFGHEERNLATALGVMANQLGVAVGFVIGPQLVSTGSDMWKLLLVEAIFACVCFVFVALFFANEPPVPPSFAAITTATPGVSRTFRSQLAVLTGNRSFLYLLSAYGANVGMYYAMSTFINQILQPHFPSQDVAIGWIGFVIVVAGILGDVAIGVYLDKTHRYKAGFLGCNGGAIVWFALFIVAVHLEMLWLVFIAAGMVGLCGTSVLVLGLEFAAQITFPIAEATSSGLLNLSAQIYGAVLVGVLTLVETHVKNGITVVNWTLVAVLVVAQVMMLPVESRLMRNENEKSYREQSGSVRTTSVTSGKGATTDPRRHLLTGHAIRPGSDPYTLDTPQPNRNRHGSHE